MKRFTRHTEDFQCANCGNAVQGNGYTNHCPRCLFSKHVDVYPGDRSAACGGMMAPISVVTEQGEYRLTHRCLKCGHVGKNRAAPEDSTDELIRLQEGVMSVHGRNT